MAVAKRILRLAVILAGIAPAVLFPAADASDDSSTIRTAHFRHLSSSRGELPVPTAGNEQTACVIADLDGDGRQDIVIAERTNSPSLVWIRFASQGWQRRVIDDTALPIEAGGVAADIDGDGKLDLVFGGDWRSNHLWWWKNPAPHFDRPWQRFVIKNSGGNQHHDQIWGDFTGDGRPELVFWNQRARTLFMAELPRDPYRTDSWQLVPIWSWEKGSYEGFAAGDINGDGRVDLVGGGYWFEYRGSREFRAHRISDYGRSRSAVADFDGDGRPEVVLNSGDGVGPLVIFRYVDGRWQPQVLVEKVEHGHTLEVADINGDGFVDIYAAEMHTPGAGDRCRQWIFYGNGKGDFHMHLLSVGICNHESRLADVNGDGRLDIVGKPYTWQAPRLDIWLNLGQTE